MEQRAAQRGDDCNRYLETRQRRSMTVPNLNFSPCVLTRRFEMSVVWAGAGQALRRGVSRAFVVFFTVGVIEFESCPFFCSCHPSILRCLKRKRPRDPSTVFALSRSPLPPPYRMSSRASLLWRWSLHLSPPFARPPLFVPTFSHRRLRLSPPCSPTPPREFPTPAASAPLTASRPDRGGAPSSVASLWLWPWLWLWPLLPP